MSSDIRKIPDKNEKAAEFKNTIFIDEFKTINKKNMTLIDESKTVNKENMMFIDEGKTVNKENMMFIDEGKTVNKENMIFIDEGNMTKKADMDNIVTRGDEVIDKDVEVSDGKENERESEPEKLGGTPEKEKVS